MVIKKKIPFFNFLRRYYLSLNSNKIIEKILPKVRCIDIGASIYEHTKWIIFLNSKNTNWIAIDPVKENLNYLKNWTWNSKIRIINNAIHSENRVHDLYITNAKTGSSLKKIDIHPCMEHRVSKNYIYPIKREQINVISLKNLIEENSSPCFIKLDTQGTEFEILESVQTYIKNYKILGLEIECSLLAKPNHIDSTKFHEVQKFMENHNYELIDFKLIRLKQIQLNKRNNYIPNECDAIFAPRFDIVKKMNLNNQILVLGFYISYHLKSEAINLIDTLEELKNFLKDKKIYNKLRKQLINSRN